MSAPTPSTLPFLALFMAVLLPGCGPKGPGYTSATHDMVAELESLVADADPMQNPWDNERRLAILNAQPVPNDPVQKLQLQGNVAQEFLLSGRAQLAATAFELMIKNVEDAPEIAPDGYVTTLRQLLGLAYLRLGEQENCIDAHVASACILPFDPSAEHKNTRGARSALETFQALERTGGATSTTRYLMNVAAMALGEHPNAMPSGHILSPEQMLGPHTPGTIEAFPDVAGNIGLDVRGLSGGSITEDFDGDGDLDVVVSSWGLLDQMRYFSNEGDRGFVERTQAAGLEGQRGGLNMKHADYDNDGDFDILVLRGAWLGRAGYYPNSLLQNQGDGVFIDVTSEAGMLSFHPTQVAEWNDFDGDGFLDVFIGNESTRESQHSSQLYRNNGDGSFSDVASDAGLDMVGYVKGATSADIDQDGDPDLYISMLGEANRLFENREGRFYEISAGVQRPYNSFPTWFFDYNQDGLPDLLALGYGGDMDTLTLALTSSGARTAKPTIPRLYRNDGDKTFTDVTESTGLEVFAKAMGSNYGDLDNDGFPDFYIGTGDPDFRSLVPNRMFRNNDGNGFEDVTLAGRFGHLQKGHGVSFADLDSDGDQDVHIVMGGAFSGDVYHNAVFQNPGTGDNKAIVVELEGVSTNRAGVGATIRAVIGDRSVYGTVTTGGSFGANPHAVHLGLGKATRVDSLEITWPWNRGTQVFTDLEAGQRYTITESSERLASRVATQ